MLGKTPETVDSKLPDDVDEIEETEEEAPAVSRPSSSRKTRSLGGMPNVPSFLHTGGKDPKPKLPRGEKILKEGTTMGVKWVWTSGARKIFLCSIAEYLDKVGPLLPSTAHYAKWFPWAAPEMQKKKG